MNYTRFEELNGIQLGMFTADATKGADFDDGILAYYYQRKANLDSPHLEMIILLLGKLGTPAALNEVACFLDHPVKSLRYQAAQVITNAASLDERAMAKIISILSNAPYPDDLIQIEDALNHAGTETAKSLVVQFREANRPQRGQRGKPYIEFGISQIKSDGGKTTIEGRCHHGPIVRGDTFILISEMTVETSAQIVGPTTLHNLAPVKITIESIWAYGKNIQELSQTMTARLEISGTGIELLKPSLVLSS